MRRYNFIPSTKRIWPPPFSRWWWACLRRPSLCASAPPSHAMGSRSTETTSTWSRGRAGLYSYRWHTLIMSFFLGNVKFGLKKSQVSKNLILFSACGPPQKYIACIWKVFICSEFIVLSWLENTSEKYLNKLFHAGKTVHNSNYWKSRFNFMICQKLREIIRSN